MNKKLLVIDGNSILNRAFYGIRLLTNKEGLFTNAVYGMVTMITKQVEKIKPDYCAVAFDLKAPTFRHNMYEGYKSNRKGMPEELAVQLPYAKECMKALGYHVVSMEGYEADDILGTLSAEANKNGVKAYVLTGDRDSLQLINNDTTVLLVKTKETIEFTLEEFVKNYGISPAQFVDVKALMGDTSDNIPGVMGIGEKTALKLIADFNDIDSLYNAIEEAPLSPSVKSKLLNGRDSAYLSKELAKIKTDVPVESSFEEYAYTGIIEDQLYELFVKLDFSALIQKFDLHKPEAKTPSENATTIQLDKISYKNTLEASANEFAVTITQDNKILLFDGESLYLSNSFDDLPTGTSIVCYDYKNIVKKSNREDISCSFDVMLASYVLDATMGNFSLENICTSNNISFDNTDKSKVVAIYDLYKMLKPKISEENLDKLLYDIEIPLAKVLAEMELTGFKIDINGISNYGEELKQLASDLQTRIYSYVGEEFNIASTKQLGEVLFEKLGLPKSKKTKTGYSTDAETLQKLVSYHPIIEDILDYRQITKLKSTYADGLLKEADDDGRIHSIFNQTGTATGRLSSSEPNLQNIPIKTEAGRKFRKYFIPKSSDYVLIDADYSQIELRILANMAQDEIMINAFLLGEDIHTTTAARVFGVAPQNVTMELRKKAKAVNFGIIYGMGEYSLSEDLGISRAQAKKYIDSYFEKFPNVYNYLQNVKEQAKEKGYVLTEFGRKRNIPEIFSSNKNLQHFGERVAMNSPIQGTAADIIKIAMVSVAKELKEKGIDAKLILQVHDELLIEAHRDCADEAYNILVNSMENAIKMAVPLDVDAHIGNNWYEAK